MSVSELKTSYEPGNSFAFQSTLQTLLRLGVARKRAEKALASTGNRGAHVASDWLLAHVDDSTLDETCPRIFYLCLHLQLRSKLSQSIESMFRLPPGSAQRSKPPFCTLDSVAVDKVDVIGCAEKAAIISRDFLPCFSVFEATVVDAKVPDFVDGVAKVLVKFKGRLASLKNVIDVEKVNIEEDLLRSLFEALQGEAAKVGVEVLVSQRAISSLQLGCRSEHYSQKLHELLRKPDARVKGSECEFQLYSSDARFVGKTAHRVIREHSSRDSKELELMIGDFVYVGDDSLGVSWLSGRQGFFPQGCVERCLESVGWTMHFSLPLDGDKIRNPSLSPPAVERLAKLSEVPSSLPSCRIVSNKGQTRQIFIVRHGEGVDFTFGSWIPHSFDSKNNYSRNDLNMPVEVPIRSCPNAFARDCPLTRIGSIQSRLTGDAMRENGVMIHHVYASPSLRCIETAHNILLGLGRPDLKIHVEPGLFEWLAWYQDGMPDWMSTEDLKLHGFNVDDGYEPYISEEELRDSQAQLQQTESVDQYYTRNSFVTRCILQATEDPGGNLLLVGHAATLDACSRQVTGSEPRSLHQMLDITSKVGYCGVAFLQEESQEESPEATSDLMNRARSALHHRRCRKVWKLKEPSFPPMTHCNNLRFDWKSLVLDRKD